MRGLADSDRWSVLTSDERAERALMDGCGVPPLVARVLAARGMTDPDEVGRFLTPDLDREWHEPSAVPGLSEAADRVGRALDAGEKIAVFGDFDVDGMTSTCLLTLGLRALGAAEVRPYIPHRFGEGYGLSRDALCRVMADGRPDLIITVDNGIAAAREVEWLLSEGVDVVVTDHHEPADLVPAGVPVCDPKLSADCPSRELAGVGVALKLVAELGARRGRPDLWRDYIDVAALGTISDMMLLTGENRALVAAGISLLRETRRPGIVALAAAAGVDLAAVTADSLPFSLIPRLNAAGRMGFTEVALDVLLTGDPEQGALLAGRLESINNERREIESQLAEEAFAKVEASYEEGCRVIVVAGEGWHEGVKGVVATRVVGAYHVPAILFTISDGVAIGSGRSVGSVDLFHAVEQCSDLCVRFGGHPGAVGVTVDAANLDAFRERLESVLAELPDEKFVSTGEVAAVVGLGELDVRTIGSLEMLQPFGQGNKKPLLAATGVVMRGRSRVGGNHEHLRFAASDGIHNVPAIMFRTPDIERACDCDAAVDLVFEPVVETWQGRVKPKLMVKDILYRCAPEPAEGDTPSLSDDLFARSHEVLSGDEYAGVARSHRVSTRVTVPDDPACREAALSLPAGEVLLPERRAGDSAGQGAVALVRSSGQLVGYLRRQVAAAIAPRLDAGDAYVACVRHVCSDDARVTVTVDVERLDATADLVSDEATAAAGERRRLAGLDADALTDELRRSMIGDSALLPAQRRALDVLAAGRSALCVMATGRGKSLVFHVHAAREAILAGGASVFVYPLRALVADQAFHLSEALEPLGVSVRVLTGETSAEERDEVFSALSDGACDVVLTTPEFLAIHVGRFAASGRVRFLVVDEAHHAASAERAAYSELPRVREALSEPRVLAVTATASTEAAHAICGLLGIAEGDVVVDATVRSNLRVEDARELRDREAALTSVVATGEKTVVYVNSREQSVLLARTLRKAVPDMGQAIAYYNAGLGRADRARIERAFRDGMLSCIVSTSAFGEGVNLPDVRHVVLYHMPFGSVEFNQMSGRAGRDGAPATIHLLFGERDARLNERLLESSAPARDDLVLVYRVLTQLSRRAADAGEGSAIAATNADIATSARELDPATSLDERAVSCGIAVFRELGFLGTSGYGSSRTISMEQSPARMRLDSSIRYLEGMRSRDAFQSFRDWVLSASPEVLLDRINRPIVPDFGTRTDERGDD